MWLLHRHTHQQVLPPVAGTYVTTPTIDISRQQTALVAIRPTDNIINAPLDGDIVRLSPTEATILAINGHTYMLHVEPAKHPVTCDWQVRVGDSVSPLTILGMLTGPFTKAYLTVSQLNSATTSDRPVLVNQ